MANYESTSRTNYFHVTDEARYQKLISHLCGTSIETFDETEEDGRILHGFGAYGSVDFTIPPSLDKYVIPFIENNAVFDENGKTITREDIDKYDEIFDVDENSIYEEDINFDVFVKELQKILPDNEVFVYMESGSEKLRYVSGYAIIASKTQTKNTDLDSFVEASVKELLGQDASTKYTY